jgi:aerobic carbon-monoxide dehydrogenase small subunit
MRSADCADRRADKMAESLAISLNVNGCVHALSVRAHHTLLDVLRGQLGLTGSKECCGEGECGACTVLLNGRAVNACLVLAAEADGDEILTIEGLARGAGLDPLQEAFVTTGGVQCGFCIPGMIMAARYLLMTDPHPSEAAIRKGLAGNLCRCASYSRIVEAVRIAAGAPPSEEP